MFGYRLSAIGYIFKESAEQSALFFVYIKYFLYLCSEFGEWAFVRPEP